MNSHERRCKHKHSTKLLKDKKLDQACSQEVSKVKIEIDESKDDLASKKKKKKIFAVCNQVPVNKGPNSICKKPKTSPNQAPKASLSLNQIIKEEVKGDNL